MDRSRRMALMKDALGKLARKEVTFVVFIDQATEDYVQFDLVPTTFINPATKLPIKVSGDLLGPSLARFPRSGDPSIPIARMEVVARGISYPTQPGMTKLSASQVSAIKKRGFSAPNPNFQASIDLIGLDVIVQECEELFAILGSAADFNLHVEL